MSLNRYRLQHLVKQKHKGAILAHKLLQRPDRLLGLILLGNNFVNILASSLTTVIAIRLMGDSGIAIAAGILTLVILIFSEVAPKTLAAIKPELLAFPAAWIYTPLLKICYPIVWLVNLLANFLLRIIGIHPQKKKATRLNKEELKTIVTEAGNVMPAKYQNMLLGILDMEYATIEDIMTPRNEIFGIDLEDSIEEIKTKLKVSPHTRVPVYKKSMDRIIGFLHLRKILTQISIHDLDKQYITSHLIKPLFIPDITPLHKQMQNFKIDKQRIGLVVDEYGDVQGLVSLDDLLEGIVGEIITEAEDVQKQKDGSYLVQGSVTIRELNRVTQWSLPTEGPKTLNGLIIEFMETIPEPGTSVVLHGYPLEIMQRDGNTIKLVKFHPHN